MNDEEDSYKAAGHRANKDIVWVRTMQQPTLTVGFI